jgi:hypothetical protein
MERILNCPRDNGYPRCSGCSIVYVGNERTFIHAPPEGCDYKVTQRHGEGIKPQYRISYGGASRDNIPEDLIERIKKFGTLGIGTRS